MEDTLLFQIDQSKLTLYLHATRVMVEDNLTRGARLSESHTPFFIEEYLANGQTVKDY